MTHRFSGDMARVSERLACQAMRKGDEDCQSVCTMQSLSYLCARCFAARLNADWYP